jgi:hypothetical protein
LPRRKTSKSSEIHAIMHSSIPWLDSQHLCTVQVSGMIYRIPPAGDPFE